MLAEQVMTCTLIGLSISPWTVNASFTLDHARIAYEYIEHTPMLGELWLRTKARQKPASVPLLLDEAARPVMGTWAIAEYVNGRTDGTLIPADERAAVRDWHERSDRLLDAARVLLFERLVADDAALRESLPAFLPAALRGPLTFSAKQAVKYLQKKYAGKHPRAPHEIVHAELEHLAHAIEGRATLLDHFSYADIAMASTINGFAPTELEPRTRAMGPALRACWARPELIERFPTLLTWRDAIYQHR